MIAMDAKHVVLLALLAQAVSPNAVAEDKDKAQVLLQQGLALDKRGLKTQALEKFWAAYAAFPSPKLWFNIGQVERDLGHSVEAAEAFERFLALVPDARPENKNDATNAVADLGKQLGRLQVRCETIGADVLVDGKSAGQVPLPQPIWATPGRHQVTIRREGFATASETVEMIAGATALVVMRLAPFAVASPAAPAAATAAPPLVLAPQLPGQPIGLGATATIAPPPAAPPVAVFPAPAPEPAPPAALDLTAQPVPDEGSAEARPIYATWWFWTGAAMIATGVVTTLVLLSGKQDSNVPGTALGNHGAFQ